MSRRFHPARWPTLITAVICLLALTAIFLLVDPAILQPFWYLPVWVLMWVLGAAAVRLITGRRSKGLIYGTAGAAVLVFRFFELTHPVYPALLLGLASIADWYWSSRK